MIQPISTETRVKNSVVTAATMGALGVGAQLLDLSSDDRKQVIAAIKTSFLSEDSYIKKTVDCAKKSIEGLAEASAQRAKTAPFVNNLKKYNIDLGQVAANAKAMYPGVKQVGTTFLKEFGKTFAKFAAFSIAIDIATGLVGKAIDKSFEKKLAKKAEI